MRRGCDNTPTFLSFVAPDVTHGDPPAGDLRDVIRVARGLSAVFWGMPLALLICVRASASNWLKTPDAIHPVAALGLVCFGVWQLKHLRDVNPAWRAPGLELTQILALVQVGLSPFIFFWNRQPDQPFFGHCLLALAVTGLLFLLAFNRVIRGLDVLFPEGLARAEIRLFSRMNGISILVLLAGAVSFVLVRELSVTHAWMAYVGGRLLPVGFFSLLVFTLLPITMTMTMTWKIKEELLHQALNATGAKSPSGPPPLPDVLN